MSSPTAQALRGVGLARLFVGAVTLVMVGRGDLPVLSALPPRAVAAARLLAVRDLAQGSALVTSRENHVVRAARTCSAVDAVHAASMLALITSSRRYRRAATLSAASTLTWIVVTAAAERPQPRRSLIHR